jgi:hypothetical protein
VRPLFTSGAVYRDHAIVDSISGIDYQRCYDLWRWNRSLVIRFRAAFAREQRQ